MQRKVIALSRCLGPPISSDKDKRYYRFHFKGVYSGHSIIEIHLRVKDNKTVFMKGHDYLLYIHVAHIINERLIGQLIHHKRV